MAPAVPLARRLLRVRDLIERAYAGPLDLAALARSAHVSESHFSRSFADAFGVTPHRYLLTTRLERAKALLRDTDLSVTEICLRVGFTSLGSFSTQFRRFVGESPTGYRVRPHGDLARIPTCLVRQRTRPTPGQPAETRSRQPRLGEATTLGGSAMPGQGTWQQTDTAPRGNGPARLEHEKVVDLMADGPLKPGDLTPARVVKAWSAHAQVVARDQLGIIYGGGAAKLTAGQHVRIRINEINGSNGYKFTASLLEG